MVELAKARNVARQGRLAQDRPNVELQKLRDDSTNLSDANMRLDDQSIHDRAGWKCGIVAGTRAEGDRIKPTTTRQPSRAATNSRARATD